MIKGVATLCAAAMLAACGGGGDSASSPTEAAVNSTPNARAGAPQSVVVGTAVTLDGAASSDADGDALTYAWTIASAPAGSVAALTGPTTARPTLTPDMPGSYTLSLVVSDGRLQSAASTVVLTATAPVAPQIALSGSEPLTGTVQLTLTGTVSGAVTWYIDLGLLGPGAAASGNGIAWDTMKVANGQHLVTARIQTGSGFQDIKRTVTVGNSNVTLSASVYGTTGTIQVYIYAKSVNGINLVSATLDGGSAVTLTAPNYCSKTCKGTNGVEDLYLFQVDALQARSGSHTLQVHAADRANDSLNLAVPIPVSNPVVVNLASPLDGTFVYRTLNISGTAVSDKPGAVSVIAQLGDTEFMHTTQTAFSGSLDLTGVAPGTYTLTITAVDSSNMSTWLYRSLVVVSTAALAYAPAFILPPEAEIKAAEGNSILYVASNSVRVRNLVSGSELALEYGAESFPSGAGDWQLNDGRAYAQGRGADCASTCIYQWDATGARLNLSVADPYTTAAGSGVDSDLEPVARDGYVLWVNWRGNGSGYTLYDVMARTYRQIPPPTTASYIGNTDYDFALVGGIVHFYYWAQTGGSGAGSSFDLYKWTSDTGASTRLTAGSARNTYPQTDGERVAWQQSPTSGNPDGSISLQTMPLAAGSFTTVAAKANSYFLLRDRVLAWTETVGSSRILKASALLQTTTLATASDATLLANGGGKVVYKSGGKVYSWDSVSGTSTLRVETSLSRVYVAGGAMVFVLNTLVYRVSL